MSEEGLDINLPNDIHPAKFLYSGLKEKERYAMYIVNRYLEECDATAHKKTSKQALGLEELLTWTSLYYRKEKLTRACFGKEPREQLDWFRIVCCLLDEKRLRRATENCSKNSYKKGLDGFNHASVAQNTSIPSETTDTKSLLNATNKRQRVIEKAESEYSTLRNSIGISQNDVTHQKNYKRTSLFSLCCICPQIKEKTLPGSHPSISSPTCLQQPATSSITEAQDACYASSTIKLQKQLSINFLYRWGIVTLDCFLRSFHENSMQELSQFCPQNLSCGQLISLYKHILDILVWVADCHYEAKNATLKGSDDQAHSPWLVEPILSTSAYIEKITWLEYIITQTFFPERVYSRLYHCSKEAKDTFKFMEGRSPHHESDVTEINEKDALGQEVSLYRISLEGDMLVFKENLCLTRFTSTFKEWSNPLFFKSIAECLLNFNVKKDIFSLMSLIQKPTVDDSNQTEERMTWNYDAFFHLSDSSKKENVVFPKHKLAVFLLGVLSLVQDVFKEFWIRLQHIVNSLLSSSLTDTLQELRSLGQSLIITRQRPSNGLFTNVEYSRLFDQLETFLTHEYIPLDLVDGASKAWILVEKAQAEWNRIQNENQLKKKLKEEKEKAERLAEAQETEKREQQRRAAVEYVKKGISKELHYNVSNPFWIIGLAPQVAAPVLFSKIKRRLSLLLHPDKCLDPDLKADAQLAFTMVTNAIVKAEELYCKGKHLFCSPPSERPPFAEEVGIPDFKPTNFTSVTTKPSPVPNAKTSNEEKAKSNFSRESDAHNVTTNVHYRNQIKFEVWSAVDFDLLTQTSKPNDAWGVSYDISTGQDKLEPPHFVTHSATKGNIWVSIPERPKLCIRVFISRPWPQPKPDDSNAQAHRAEDGISFLLPNYLATAVDMCSRVTENAITSLSAFSCVLLVRMPSLNLSEWTSTHKDVIQPILDSKKQFCSLYVGAQTVDVIRKTVSRTVWTTLPPRRFTMPSTKPKVIKLIQLFSNAPACYKIFDVLREFRKSYANTTIDHFPLVKEMGGWTYSTLCLVLNALMENVPTDSSQI